MLITQAFTDYLVALSERQVSPLPDDLLKVQIPLVLIQCLARTLLAQNSDGSWGSVKSKENTAYALMILKASRTLPFDVGMMRTLSDSAIERGRMAVASLLDGPFNDYNWNGKCSFGLLTVSRAAAISALFETRAAPQYSFSANFTYKVSLEKVTKQVQFFSHLPSLKETPRWMIEVSVIEAELCMHKLLEIDYLEQKAALGEKVPRMLITICGILNYQKRAALSNRVILNMVDTLLRIIYIDHFQDTVIKDRSSEAIQVLEKEIYQLFSETNLGARTVVDSWAFEKAYRDATNKGNLRQEDNNPCRLLEAIQACKEHYISDETVQAASPHDRRWLLLSLRNSFLAQVCNFSLGNSLGTHCQKGLTLYDWVRGLGADSIFSSFPIKLLLLQNNYGLSEDIFSSTFEKHLLEEYCHHLAVAARLANDCGGLERDRAESNVNALEFPELRQTKSPDYMSSGCQDYEHKIEDVLEVIRYERDLRDNALAKLKTTLAIRSKSKAAAITVLILDWYRDLADCFDDLYSMMY
jgi:hypothetical protein